MEWYLCLCLQWSGHLYVTPFDGRGVGGGGGSLLMLPVLRASLCTIFAGVKLVYKGSLVVSAVEWSSL